MIGDLSGDDCALLRMTLENAGVEIRTEACDGGGIVRMDGRYIVFVPLTSTSAQMMEIYLHSIRKLAASLVHIAPRVRRLLGEEDWDE
jgi:hypothetical protein